MANTLVADRLEVRSVTQTSSLRVVAGVGLPLFSVLLLRLALPPYALWPLIAVGDVPLSVAHHRSGRRQRLRPVAP